MTPNETPAPDPNGPPPRDPAPAASEPSTGPTRPTDPATPPPASTHDQKTVVEPPGRTNNTPFGPGNEPLDPGASLPQSLRGRYRLIRVLGKGGFANVYLAYDNVLDQSVAIKILKLHLTSKTDGERFLREARIGAKLRHPNIAQVFDIIQTPDGLQMIMEYYPGGTLTEHIKLKGPLHPREAVDFARQIALALAYAHKRDVIHRDIKPANIFLAAEGMIKLGDFGIASHAQTHEFTQTGMIIGTPLYMAPEQANDSRDVDPRTDLFALGLTLYHMLTGRPPRVIDLAAIPEGFRKLIKSATEHNRTERLVSAEQFVAMLDQIELRTGASKAAGASARAPAPDRAIGSSAELTPPTPTPAAGAGTPPSDAEKTPAPSLTNPAAPSASDAPASAPVPPPTAFPPPLVIARPLPAYVPWLIGALAAAGLLVLAMVIYFVTQPKPRQQETRNVPRPAPTASGTPVAAIHNQMSLPARATYPAPAQAKPTVPAPSVSAPVSAPPPSPAATPPTFLPPSPSDGVLKARNSRPYHLGPPASVNPPLSKPVEQPKSVEPLKPVSSPKPADQVQMMRQAVDQLRRENHVVDSTLQLLEELSAKASLPSYDRNNIPPPLRDRYANGHLARLETEIENSPNDPVLHLVTGASYDRVGRGRPALEHYRAALGLVSKNGGSFVINGRMIREVRHYLRVAGGVALPADLENPPAATTGPQKKR